MRLCEGAEGALVYVQAKGSLLKYQLSDQLSERGLELYQFFLKRVYLQTALCLPVMKLESCLVEMWHGLTVNQELFSRFRSSYCF